MLIITWALTYLSLSMPLSRTGIPTPATVGSACRPERSRSGAVAPTHISNSHSSTPPCPPLKCS